MADEASPVVKYTAFQSTIEPDRWYVATDRVALLATEIGASGEREARLVAELLNRHVGEAHAASGAAERLAEDEAIDAVADSIGSCSAVYGPTEGWAEGKTLTVLFKATGQLAKFRFAGLRDKPSPVDLIGAPE